MDRLGSNPGGGSSGIYGQPGEGPSAGDALNFVNQLKDREMRDFRDKANFMSDLSLKQESRMRSLYDPNPTTPNNQQPQNVVMGQDPNQMTGYQKADLGVRQQGMNLESQRLGQQGKLSQEALDIKSQQEKLNQTKSDQIHEQKQADMQRKINDANDKLGIAYEQLNSKNNNAEQTLAAHKAIAEAMEERHKLELAQKDAQFQKVSGQHQQTIDNLTKQLEQRGRSKVTTEVNPEGTQRTTTTERGAAADTVQVTGRDGNPYTIPKDKLDDWNQNHKPEGEE